MRRTHINWEFTLKSLSDINFTKIYKVIDASFGEAKREIEKHNPNFKIIGYECTSGLEDSQILVTPINLSFGITLYSKNDNKLPFYKMTNKQFVEVDLNDKAFKNEITTYKDLIQEKFDIFENQIIRKS